MRKSQLMGSILLAGGLVACTTPPVPAPVPPVTSAVSEPTAVRPMGQLTITIRWPRQIQLLPYSTNRVAVRIEDGNGQQVAATSIEQPTGTSTSETRVSVPAGDGLKVTVEAYQDTLKVAEGEATTSVKVNERTSLAIHLTPTLVPSVTAYTPNGGVGAVIALTGTLFGASRNVPIQVNFGGQAATAVYRLDDEHLLAIVPPGISSASIVVTVDGVASAPTDPFWVIQGLTALDQSSYSLASGDTLPLSITATTAQGPLGDPYVEWAIVPVETDSPANMASGSFSVATGSATVFTAIGTGSAILRVRSGSVQSTASLTIH